MSLLTDFGLVDPFVAEMKVAILSICPRARIVDVSHGVAEFDIKMGAFLLAEAGAAFLRVRSMLRLWILEWEVVDEASWPRRSEVRMSVRIMGC